MRTIRGAGAGAVLAAAALALSAGPASALGGRNDQGTAAPGQQRAVFVQTDSQAGNQVVAYERSGNGSLTQLATYDTGGLGGALSGSVVDHLASQGSLAYDAADGLLYAVNAGSSTVSVFGVAGEQLTLRQVISSGGTFPVSVAFSHGLVYVLNAEDGGFVQGFAVVSGHLAAIAGSGRALGLDPNASPQFTNTPGQVAFSPGGSQLIVTTKANGSSIDVFSVDDAGQLSSAPVVNSEPGAVPFGVTFDGAGNLIVSEAGPNALQSFALNADRTVSPLDSAATGQAATCWVVSARGFLYASNAGSASLSGFTSSATGGLALLGNTETDPGTVDAAASSDGHHLYVQAGATGVVDEFAIDPHGTLAKVGSVTVAGAVGGEGIAAQ